MRRDQLTARSEVEDSGAKTSNTRQKRLRRFTVGTTVCLIVLCNAVFLLGIWWSNVNLERAFSSPEFYDPRQSHCVRLAWTKVAGIDRPVQVCYEWIDLSDPSGETHTLTQEIAVVKGVDGRFYYGRDIQADYRLIGLGIFVLTIMITGILLKRYLINRYRARLDQQERPSS